MRYYMEKVICYLEAEEKKKQKELAFQERQKKYKGKEKNHEIL